MIFTTKLLLLVGFLALLLFIPLIIPSGYILNLFITVFLYGGLVLSWHFLSGYTRYVSFGHAAFVGTASYAAGLSVVLLKLPLPLAILIGGAITGLIGLGVGFSSLRLRGYYFSIATLMLVFIGSSFFSNISDVIPGVRSEMSFPMLPLDIIMYRALFYYIFFAYLLGAVVLSIWLERSKFGYGLMSLKEDEDVAESVGVNTTRLKVTVCFLSAFFAGIIGATNAQYITYVDVPTSFNILTSFNMMFMSYFGGIGTWVGPLIASALLIPVNETLSLYIKPEFARMSYGVLFILVILLMPDGLYGFYKRRLRAKK
jgi:branched-chain amino acid transport system permease protein